MLNKKNWAKKIRDLQKIVFKVFFFFFFLRPVYMPEYTLGNMCNTTSLDYRVTGQEKKKKKVEILNRDQRERIHIFSFFYIISFPELAPSFSFLVPTN